MSKAKKIFTNTRILILIAALLIALVLIHPSFKDGVAIRSVAKNSVAAEAGMVSPGQGSKPMSREVIVTINDQKIIEVKDYYEAISLLQADETFTLKTNKETYFLTTRAATVNLTDNNSLIQDIGLTVYPRPKSNVQKGLDLEGGTRVLLEPEEEASEEDMSLVVANIEQRLNVYGVSDVSVRVTKDLFGKSFISVEIPGANEQEVRSLLAQQGKFEAKIGEDTVFRGGEKDILYVCRTADCSGIEPGSCGNSVSGETVCRFRFSITLSGEAARRQAQLTDNLSIISLGTGIDNAYLDKNLSLFLDDELVDELLIGADLKGNEITQISISGSGTGIDSKDATEDALKSMKNLQTVLQTGSLPVKLKVVKTESISPALGSSFIKNAALAGLLALLLVVIIIAIRYREFIISIPIVITILSEFALTLGVASLIGWRLDIAAVAAIIIAVGSGVNDQIVITDETLGKEKDKKRKDELESWKVRLKRALFIVFAAYFTMLVAMLPLWFAGAGLLKGFALTTIIGITVGVLITRPAYGEFLEIITENK
ncbi:MAG: MMPL family transporter [Candidatus Nanoarchaeia archaeon]